MWLYALAAFWGFAEATLFFIVPDVLLTGVALEDRGRSLRACAATLAGALVGGSLMYFWGAAETETVLSVLDGIPAISTEMLKTVSTQMQQGGSLALFIGPLTGVPYKVYAAQAADAQVGLAVFLLISIPARFLRFAALCLLANALSRRFLATKTLRQRRWIHLTAWTLIYIVYFLLKPG